MLLYHYLYVNILPYIRLRSLFLCTTSSVRTSTPVTLGGFIPIY